MKGLSSRSKVLACKTHHIACILLLSWLPLAAVGWGLGWVGDRGEDDAREDLREGGKKGATSLCLPWLKPPAVASQDSTPEGMRARDDPVGMVVGFGGRRQDENGRGLWLQQPRL